MWVWVRIKPGDRRFWSMFPLTRVPFGVPIFYPQPGKVAKATGLPGGEAGLLRRNLRSARGFPI